MILFFFCHCFHLDVLCRHRNLNVAVVGTGTYAGGILQRLSVPERPRVHGAVGLAGVAGNLADAAVTTLTGNRFLGDLSGAVVSNLL